MRLRVILILLLALCICIALAKRGRRGGKGGKRGSGSRSSGGKSSGGKSVKSPKCRQRCHQFAFCQRGRCVCRRGFTGNGVICRRPGTCNPKCHPMASCNNGRCVCRSGYSGNGRSCSRVCKPKCHPMASCNNGRCVCRSGYSGNGRSCTRTCKPKCHPMASCNNGRCVCRSGYSGNGRSCTRVCKPKCHPMASCKNGRCVCRSGYSGNGRSCTRKPKQCNPRCHKNARCKNGKCKCKNGFRGDGVRVCNATPKPCNPRCHKNARCKNGKCKCKNGFRGDGVRVCKSTPKPCNPRCHKNARCKNGKCKCKNGFRGDGVRVCNATPKQCNPRCHKNARCRNGKCQCKNGFKGDGVRVCNATPKPCNPRCHKNARCKNGKCKCKNGFRGDGVRVCKATPKQCNPRCHKNARCKNGKCKCKNGFRGDGVRVCNATPKQCKPKCNKNARCRNGKCKCKNGYKGDGVRVCNATPKQCNPKCHKKARCRNGKCKCKNGFRGDGVRVCNAAPQQCNPKCHKKARCRNGKCQCKNGYKGDGVRVCNATTKQCNPKCHKKARCRNGKCQCKNGYKGDGVRVCNGQPPSCKRKCHKNGRCKNGKCKCKKGYRGDGVKVCKKKQTNPPKVICEGKQDTIRCPNGGRISIMKAYYGRSDRKTCKHTHMKDTTCRSPKSPSTIRSMCNGKNSCLLKSNNGVYGDPCPGTYKYISVAYKCSGKTPSCKRKCHKNGRCKKGKCKCKKGYRGDGVNVCKKKQTNPPKVICEGKQDTIRCPNGGRISIMKAYYGRSDRKTCKHTHMKDTTCRSPKSPSTIRSMCNGKKSCLLKSNNGVYGDPCPGTYKYISVAYKCSGKPPSCKRKCHKNGRCKKGKCKCKKGYRGDGVNVCKKKQTNPPKVICEGKQDTIRCPNGGRISIMKAYYGRSDRKTCKHTHMKDTTCRSPKSPSTIRSMCNGKKSCLLKSNNGVYGDPCPGTYKYISVAYKCSGKPPSCKRKCHKNGRCKKGKCKCKKGYRGDGVNVCKKKQTNPPKVICEGKQDTIRCPNGGRISIMKAYYGRSDRKTCKHTHMKDTTCRSPKSPSTIRSMCNGKKSCLLKSNNGVYGDPCPGTYKYISVAYKCSGKPPSCKRKCHKNGRCKKGKCKCKKGYRGDGVNVCKKKQTNPPKVICEGKQDTIRCPNGGRISIMKAYYGRSDRKTCKHTHMKDTTCRSPKSPSTIRSKCNGKNSCLLKSNNGVYGDPCPGTYKYISVAYKCSGKPPSCKRKCHKNGRCRNGKCKCKKGYRGDGVNICKKKQTNPPKVICEGKQDTIRCPKGGRISIMKAYYGRSDRKTCKHTHMKDASCRSRKSPSTIRSKCNGKNSCLLKSNNGVYGDPCPGTYKYISVVYKCKGSNKCRPKCHKKAKCKQGKCKCKKGYKGDGVRKCKSSNKCRPKCHKKAKCKQGKCKCKKGYKGDGVRKCKKIKLCGGKKCHKNAKCRNKKCSCRNGFIGDGVNSCSKACTCSAKGDPHFRTFDGQMIHFQGTCKYTLSQYKKPQSRCRYEIIVKNENRGNNKRVSYVRSVFINLNNAKIVFLKNKIVKVNGERKFLPYKTGPFKIINSGRFVRLETVCKVIVTWDGKSAVTVSAPKQFSDNLVGLCGDCNGIKDDFRTKEGLDVRNKANKFQLIGESYLIREGKGQICGISTPPDPCNPVLRSKAILRNACGIMNKNNRKSPFMECHNQDESIVTDSFEACIYDYCAFNDQPDQLGDAMCLAAEGLEETCENMGLDIAWRSKEFCPITCGKNMEFSSSISGCPATCLDPDAPKTCDLPPSEGCQCKKGYVLSGEECVKMSECGCRTPAGDYVPLGTKLTSKNCNKVSVCEVNGRGVPRFRVQSNDKCHINARCKLTDGQYKCVCKTGFKGDGYKTCKGGPSVGTEITICEGKTGDIKCGQNKVIRILEASYGRSDRDTCPHTAIKDTKCVSSKSSSIITSKCNGKKSCKLSSSNGVFGDPCPGTYKYIKVAYRCKDEGPTCGQNICHKDAFCRKNRCICKKGFSGDGVNSCLGTLTCSASGDPHWRTFDKQMIHFMGICTYTMAKSVVDDECGGFEVLVKNERRGSNQRVSYVSYVLIKLEDMTVKLGKKNKIFVNNVEANSPYSRGNIDIVQSGNFVRLATKCNVDVMFDGKSTVMVTVPNTYAGKVTGICGDANGKKDDYKTATGLDVSQAADKFSKIGNSYIVPGVDKSAQCVVTEVEEDPCGPGKKEAAEKLCQLLNPKNKASPFQSCVAKDEDIADDLYQSCLYDACSNLGEPNVKGIVCDIYAGYAEECEVMGLPIQWRQKSLCSVKCPTNMVYSSSVSGCPATCTNPDAPATCRACEAEGCECIDGMVLSGGKCVKKEMCGCEGPDGEYYPLGKTLTSSDCSLVTKCVKGENGAPTLESVKQRKCDVNARCDLKNGKYRCVCKSKFKGNGFKCLSIFACSPKCSANERCSLGKCLCKSAFKRAKNGACIPRNKCDPKCGKNERCVNGKCKCKAGFRKSSKGRCVERPGCKPKCSDNQRCVKGKCRCNFGFMKLLGKCVASLSFCTTPGFVEDHRAKPEKPKCKPKCSSNQRCVRGKCRCKLGFKKLLGKCVENTDCNPKCSLKERCVNRKCRCKAGFKKSASGDCVARPLKCKPRCTANERCLKGKCKCRKGFKMSKNGVCTRKGCNRKCLPTERCYKGKCKCREGFRRTGRQCKAQKDCLNPIDHRGHYYKGTVSTTISGRKCQAWSTQKPHAHSFKNLKHSHNYCRNPDNEDGPWCYTTDPNMRFELCRIPFCDTPEPSCDEWIKMTCHSKHQKRTECEVNTAERITHVMLADDIEAPSCRFGRTFGYIGNKIWTRKNCAEALKVCFIKKNLHPILPPPEECRSSDKGEEYKGTWSRTDSGKICQRWDLQYPHKHPFMLAASDAENYCRNFDGSDRPWCYTEDPETEREFCPIHRCVQEDPVDTVQNECTTTTLGKDYRGRANVTISGKACQHWEKQFPHQHPFSGQLGGDLNYCRNPDNSPRPWCYTNDPNKRWEICQIPMCSQCSISEEIVDCKAKVKLGGTCFYKSNQNSKCIYSVQMSDSTAFIKTPSHQMTMTNGGSFSDCASFTFTEGSIEIEETVCACDSS